MSPYFNLSFNFQLLAQTFTWAGLGLILLIHFVHYPSFYWIKNESFAEFHRFHSQRLSWIAGPIMIFDLLTSLAWIFIHPHTVSVMNLLLIIFLFFCTSRFSVPLHHQLSQEVDLDRRERLIRKLVSTNQYRLWAWLIKSVLLYVR